MARAALRKVGLGQHVLDATNWSDLTLIVHIFELVTRFRLIDNSIALIEVKELGSQLVVITILVWRL